MVNLDVLWLAASPSSEHSCRDVMLCLSCFLCDLDFHAKTRDNPSCSCSYFQFRRTLGQFARGAVALGAIRLENVSKPDGVFRAFLKVDLCQAFLRFFEKHGASTRTYLKSCHLSKAAKRASKNLGTLGNTAYDSQAIASSLAITATGLVSKKRTWRVRSKRSYESYRIGFSREKPWSKKRPTRGRFWFHDSRKKPAIT